LKDKVAAYAKQISDTMNMGVFSEFGVNTQPKQAVKIDLKLVQSAYAKLCVTGCIGGASTHDLYDVIKRIADYITGEALIIDLCTDTYIDDVYKGLKIKNPVEWLQGTKKINEVICDTDVRNVKVASLASTYTNPLYLLTVNWDVLLSDLAMKYNFVVLNVGNLDNIIA
jgi:MinD-like ATPase involved in chromosome partitioning or flagellar assembly